MKLRQQIRREWFQWAFLKMPLWETWVKREADHAAADPRMWEAEYDFRGIPRRVRRAMARELAKREMETLGLRNVAERDAETQKVG